MTLKTKSCQIYKHTDTKHRKGLVFLIRNFSFNLQASTLFLSLFTVIENTCLNSSCQTKPWFFKNILAHISGLFFKIETVSSSVLNSTMHPIIRMSSRCGRKYLRGWPLWLNNPQLFGKTKFNLGRNWDIKFWHSNNQKSALSISLKRIKTHNLWEQLILLQS